MGAVEQVHGKGFIHWANAEVMVGVLNNGCGQQGTVRVVGDGEKSECQYHGDGAAKAVSEAMLATHVGMCTDG